MNIKKRIYSLGFSLFIFLLAPIFTHAAELPKLIIFHSLSCQSCAEVKKEVLPKIEEEFKAKIQIEYRDIEDIENYKLMLGLREKYQADLKVILPVFFFEGHLLNGEGKVMDNLRKILRGSLDIVKSPASGARIDLLLRFKRFTPLAILIAGLQDGINPCAFTVIVFFISFLALQGYRKKELAFIGMAFIFAVFLTYLLIGIGIFNFLYRLKSFWRVVKAFNICVGIFSIILGILALYDFLKFKKERSTEGLILQLPKGIKDRIHSLVGLFFRKSKTEKGSLVRPNLIKLIASAFIAGFLVSLLEAVCTGQLYLPTIAFVLETSALKLQASGYLLLYNLMFIAPLVIVLLFALLGVRSEQFSKILKNNMLAMKILMAALFFGLGIFLIWRG